MMRSLASRAIGIVCVATLSFGGMARAGDPRAEAKSHFERGSVLFDLQRYDEAATEYEAAYEARPDPALLFNLGQAYRAARKPERAIRAYTSFLRRTPQAKNRAEIEARIEEMKALEIQQKKDAEAATAAAEAKAKADAEAAKAPPPVVETPPPPPQPRTVPPQVRTLKWAGLGLGLGGIAVGLIGAGVYGAGAAAFLKIDQPTPGVAFDPSTERSMNVLRPTGVALVVVGVAAAATGFALFGVNFKKERTILRGERAGLLSVGGSMGVSQ